MNIKAAAGDATALERLEESILIDQLSPRRIDDADARLDLRQGVFAQHVPRAGSHHVVGQKIGSHHVHGTWPSLLLHYLEWGDDGNYQPRDNNVPTDVNQYVFVPLVVLDAAKAFVTWLMDESDGMALTDMLQSCEDEIQSINRAAFGNDFRIVEQS